MADPRLTPVPAAEWTDEQRAVLEPLRDGDDVLNIYSTLAHHPDLFRRWLRFGTHVLLSSTLDPRERELAILRTGWLCGSEYEFGQHRIIGRQAGLTDDEIDRVPDAGHDEWSDRDRLLLGATDELVTDHDLSDTTWEGLAADLRTEQILDLIFLVGQYVLVSTALRALRVQREPGVEGFPAT